MDYNTIITRYYYEDGHLYYRENLSPRARKGQRVGSINGSGRWQLKYNSRTYSYSRVIYCYFNEVDYDDLPSVWDVDHLNNDLNDNRIENLLLCEHWENQLNRKDTKENGMLWREYILTDEYKERRRIKYHEDKQRQAKSHKDG